MLRMKYVSWQRRNIVPALKITESTQTRRKDSFLLETVS